MRRNLLFSIIACWAAFSFGQSVAQYSDADAVFGEINKTYVLNPDGSTRFFYSHKVKLLTYFAVNRYLGETFITYNPKFQKLVIDKSETTMADGTVVQSPANAFNEVLPASVANSPAYAFLREMVVTHTGLERNCTIDLQYHIDSDSSFMPWLMGEELFARSGPIQKMTVTVRTPNTVALHHRLFNASMEPAARKSDSYTDYIWTISDLPMLREESSHPPFEENAPRLIFSTCPDWSILVKCEADSLKDKFIISDQGKTVLLSSVSDSTQPARMLAVRKVVAEQTGTANLIPEWIGYRFSSAEEVFRRNNGTIPDKAVLLATLLKAREESADLLLISAFSQFDASVPSLLQFKGAVVRVKQAEKPPLYLLPAGAQGKPGEYEFAGRTLLDLSGSEPLLVEIPKGHAEENCLTIQAGLSLDSLLTVSGRVRVEAGGACLPAYDLSDTAARKSFVSKTTTQILGKCQIEKMTKDSLESRPPIFEANISAAEWFRKAGDQALIASAALKSTLDEWHISAALIKRFTPLLLPAPIHEQVNITVDLPEGFEVAGEIKDILIENQVGRLSLSFEHQGRQIILKRDLLLSLQTIPPALYPDFREIMMNLQAKNNCQFFLAKESSH
jgi:hypothetical protein